MKIAEIVLKRVLDSDSFVDKQKRGWCANETLRLIGQLFDIPTECSRLWLELHNRPSQYRVALQVRNCDLDYPILKRNGRCFADFNYLDAILEPLIDQSVYLQVEYE